MQASRIWVTLLAMLVLLAALAVEIDRHTRSSEPPPAAASRVAQSR